MMKRHAFSPATATSATATRSTTTTARRSIRRASAAARVGPATIVAVRWGRTTIVVTTRGQQHPLRAIRTMLRNARQSGSGTVAAFTRMMVQPLPVGLRAQGQAHIRQAVWWTRLALRCSPRHPPSRTRAVVTSVRVLSGAIMVAGLRAISPKR